jgi:hypothetical protein
MKKLTNPIKFFVKETLIQLSHTTFTNALNLFTSNRYDSYYVQSHEKSLIPYLSVHLTLFSWWQFSTWTDLIIFLGYIGLLLSAINLARRYFSKSGRKSKYLSKEEKNVLLKTKKLLRFIGPSSVIMEVLAGVGIWCLRGNLPIQYIHLCILTGISLMLGYFEISLKENSSQFPPLERVLQDMKVPKHAGFIKKLWYANAIVLLIMSILYTQLKNYPFHGIWGVLAWASTIISTYPVIFIINSEIFKEFTIHKENKIYIFIILASWIMLIYWLWVGLT